MRFLIPFVHFPEVCTRVAAIHILFVTIYIEYTVSFESQLQTSLVEHDIKYVVIAMHFSTHFEHTLCRNASTSTDTINICQSFCILSLVSISLSTVQNNLSPTANHRRRKHRAAILVTKLSHENHRITETSTKDHLRCHAAKQIACDTFPNIDMILEVLASRICFAFTVHLAFLNRSNYTTYLTSIVTSTIIRHFCLQEHTTLLRTNRSRIWIIYIGIRRISFVLRSQERRVADIRRIALV